MPGRKVHPRLSLGGSAVVTLLLLLVAFPYLRGFLPAQSPDATAARTGPGSPAIELDRFSAHRERRTAGDELNLSVRLRIPSSRTLDCFVFFVARAEQARPRVWAIWPPDSRGAAITPGGHFHGARPRVGFAVSLTSGWTRVNGIIPEPPHADGFDTIVLYVVAADGKILLARPFRV